MARPAGQLDRRRLAGLGLQRRGGGLGHGDDDAQPGRVEQRQQRPAGQGHVARHHGDVGDDAVVGCLDGEVTRLRARGLGLGDLSRGLGRRGPVLGLGLVKRGLADEAALEQLALALHLGGGHVLGGPRRLHLGRGGTGLLLGGAGVQAHQQLPGADVVAGLDGQGHHGAGHLGRHDRLSHRLDGAVVAARGAAGRRLHRPGRQCVGRLGGGGHGQSEQQRRSRQQIRPDRHEGSR